MDSKSFAASAEATAKQAHGAVYAENATRRLHAIEVRLHLLKKLAYLIQDNRKAICQSIKDDLGRSEEENEMTEIIPILKEAELAVKRLPEWMKDESCKRDAPMLLKGNNPRVRKQPKGPALIIGPWNYPWLLSIGPLIGAIAAGCPAVFKPSEHSPHSSELFAKVINDGLNDPAYRVILGEVEHSKALLAMRWGHIFFTGAPSIGRLVAAEAAKNLVPCTLELGGKCPVIIAEDANLKISARRILSMKATGSGQMCTNADYILCPASKVDALMKEMADTLEHFYPSGTDFAPLSSPNVSKMINKRGLDRAVASLDHARKAGKKILGGEVDEEQMKMAPAIVLMNEAAQGDDGSLVEEEIFGPILPVIPIKDIDAAIEYVNKGNHPLALYVFSSKKATYDYVVNRTLSGGTCWNDCAMQTIVRSLPFGGVGESGYGAGHGRAFFETFTHRRAMLDTPWHLEPFMALRYPAKTPGRFRFMLRLLGPKLSFGRSSSPEAERPLGFLRKASGWLLLAVTAIFLSRKYYM